MSAGEMNQMLALAGRIILISALFGLGWSAQAGGQEPTGRVQIGVLEPGAAVSLLLSDDYADRNSAARVISAAFRTDIYDPATGMLRVGNYARYTDAQRQALLDGVEGVARGYAPDGSVAGISAAGTALALIVVLAFDPEITAPERLGVPRRMLSVARHGRTPQEKGLALLSLGDLLHLEPPESGEILALLLHVATQPVQDGAVHPSVAIRALMNACQYGRPIRRRIHEERLARDPDVALSLDFSARNNFPLQRMSPGPPCG